MISYSLLFLLSLISSSSLLSHLHHSSHLLSSNNSISYSLHLINIQIYQHIQTSSLYVSIYSMYSMNSLIYPINHHSIKNKNEEIISSLSLNNSLMLYLSNSMIFYESSIVYLIPYLLLYKLLIYLLSLSS